jgi:hypothetical protein
MSTQPRFSRIIQGDAVMANKEQRGNREKRKPKKEKPKPAPHVSSMADAITKHTPGRKS